MPRRSLRTRNAPGPVTISKDSSVNKLPICCTLTLPSPLLFSLREAVERVVEPVTYLRTSPNSAAIAN